MSLISIRALQGEALHSPYNQQKVTTSGIVTGVLRRGFFIQTPDKSWDGKGSDGLFVYSPDWRVSLGAEVEVSGECVDFIKHDTAKPVTQLHLDEATVKNTGGKTIDPIEITRDFLPADNAELAVLLNSLEGMLVSIEAGQTFIAPSNPFGDYVLALDASGQDESAVRVECGGALLQSQHPHRWFPGFRVVNYNHAQRLNVGARLSSRISGPLNYRVDSYQIAVGSPFTLEEQFINRTKAQLKRSPGSVTIMTLNCFNLDPHVESEERVLNPRQDIDDDWGEGRFHTLAQAVVLQANTPDIVALQEIQDNDGAEISDVVDASDTYALLIKTIEQLCGIKYQWVDVAPKVGADGGQPGGNIRNGYLYNPHRVSVDPESVRVFGEQESCFEGSRKPLFCEFIEKSSGQRLAVINVHLASKRHQESIFSPHKPGFDAKEGVRIKQATVVRNEAEKCLSDGVEFYITGDFNDTEHSKTLQALVAKKSANLVLDLPEKERYDYNHRGKLQVLMHGIVSKQMQQENRAEYEIIHGNELIGVVPGEESDKPSDHAYVLAKLSLST